MINLRFGAMPVTAVKAGRKYQLDGTNEMIVAKKPPTSFFDNKPLAEKVLEPSTIPGVPPGTFTACFETDAALALYADGRTDSLALPVVLRVSNGIVGLTEIK